jgi:hypothetical protein
MTTADRFSAPKIEISVSVAALEGEGGDDGA